MRHCSQFLESCSIRIGEETSYALASHQEVYLSSCNPFLCWIFLRPAPDNWRVAKVLISSPLALWGNGLHLLLRVLRWLSWALVACKNIVIHHLLQQPHLLKFLVTRREVDDDLHNSSCPEPKTENQFLCSVSEYFICPNSANTQLKNMFKWRKGFKDFNIC